MDYIEIHTGDPLHGRGLSSHAHVALLPGRERDQNSSVREQSFATDTYSPSHSSDGGQHPGTPSLPAQGRWQLLVPVRTVWQASCWGLRGCTWGSTALPGPSLPTRIVEWGSTAHFDARGP